jgi:hypothetical protein
VLARLRAALVENPPRKECPAWPPIPLWRRAAFTCRVAIRPRRVGFGVVTTRRHHQRLSTDGLSHISPGAMET